MNFTDTAIKSSIEYYQFLENKKLGLIIENISKIEAIEDSGLLIFYIGRNVSICDDSTIITIRNVPIDPIDCRFVEFDVESHIIKVLPTNKYREKLLQANPSEVKLVYNLRFLVKRIEQWYRRYGYLVELPKARPSLDLISELDIIGIPSDDQKKAINTALTAPFSYIWGGPGTGKTKYILGQCLVNYIKAGKRILICAPTNNALEQSLDGLLTVLQHANISTEGILRIGVASSEFTEKYPEICEKAANAKRLSQINDSIIRHNNLLLELKDKQNKLRELKKYYLVNDSALKAKKVYVDYVEEISGSAQTFLDDTSKLKEILSRIDELSTNISIISVKKNEMVGLLTGAISKDIILKKGLLAVFRKKKIAVNSRKIEFYERERDGLIRTIEDSSVALDSLKTQADTFAQSIENSKKVFSEKLDSLKSIFQYDRAESQLLQEIELETFLIQREKLLNTAAEHIAIIEEKNEEYNCILRTIPDNDINECIRKTENELSVLDEERKRLTESSSEINYSKLKVIGATLDMVASRVLPDSDFIPQHVFLDEAGYCPLIKGAILTAYHAPITLLGDHMQLPPICEMDDATIGAHFPEVALWAQSSLYIEDAFECDLPALTNNYLDHLDPSFTSLIRCDLIHTYRFGKELAQVLADNVYMREFLGNEDVATIIQYVDTKKLKEDQKRTSQNECRAIVDYLKKHPEENCGIITPYNKQKSILISALQQNQRTDTDLVTVHGSQGREWNTVLFSVVDTRDMWFTDSNNQISDGKKLINTALSRAKKKLVIFCDYDYWSQQKNQLIKKVLDIAEILL